MESKKTNRVALFLLRVLQGALIGGSAILPGVSGGVLCVTFGVYRPIMYALTHPFDAVKKYWKLFLPIGIGGIVGFFGLAKLVELLLAASESITLAAFSGLIAGTVPQLFREAKEKGKETGRNAFIGFSFSLFLIFALLGFLNGTEGIHIAPNFFWFLFCGVVWGLSLVIPGLSSSSILIYMGLYEPMAAGIGNFDIFGTVLPVGLGILVTVLLTGRFVNYLFDRHHAIASHTVLGIVIASTLLIVPVKFASISSALFSLLAFAVCFALACLMDSYGDKLGYRDEKESQ